MIAGYLQQVVDTLIEAREAAVPAEGATQEAAAEFAAALVQANAVPPELRLARASDAPISREARAVSPDGSSAARSSEPSVPPHLIPTREVAGRTEVAAPDARISAAVASPTQPGSHTQVPQPNAEVARTNDPPTELAPTRNLPPIEGREAPLPISGQAPRREPARFPTPEQRVERARSEIDPGAPTPAQSARRTATESTPLRDEAEAFAPNVPERREGAATPTTPVDRSWIPERPPVAPSPQAPSLGPVESARNSAPPLPPEGASRVVQDATWLASRGGGQARVRLHPPELGEIELAVRVRNQDVEITIRAHDSRALVALTEGKELLLEGLAGRDLRAAQLQILRGGADESPATRDGESRAWNDASGDRPGSDRGQHDAENRSRLPRAFGEARSTDDPVSRLAKSTDEGAPSRGAVDIRI